MYTVIISHVLTLKDQTVVLNFFVAEFALLIV